jgi:hypothetical protein
MTVTIDPLAQDERRNFRFLGNRMLKDPAGVIVEVPHHVVEALLAVGYVPADAPEPHPALGLSVEASTPVIPAPGLAGDQRHVVDDDQPRRRGRPPKQQPVE